MAQPTFYLEGATARNTDTRLRKWKKILGAYQDANAGAAANNPRNTDTLRVTQHKLNASVNGA